MKFGFYPRLAWDGIRKNRRLYTPYILTCIGMVMMYYIMQFLAQSPVLLDLPGSTTLIMIMNLGSYTIAFFSLLFLFYSNSFLMKRRRKEFGLYNILGMGKRNVGKILFWETLMIAVCALIAGVGLGIAFSKLFELLMANIIQAQTTYDFRISGGSIAATAAVFGGIFGLILLKSLWQLSLSSPVEQLRGGNMGEKPPKAKWLMSVAGIAMLAGAYYFAATINNPTTVLMGFFGAVLVVIAATYLLFITGSVALCRMLQKNKKYYYKANHFVSVSSMAYRMKRNGAGLASICILLTMVLVMLSSTTALFVGSEDSLQSRYPKDINVTMELENYQDTQEEHVAQYREQINDVLEEHHAQAQSVYDYRVISTSGVLDQGVLDVNASGYVTMNAGGAGELVLAFVVPLSDYNKLMDEQETLDEDQVLIYPFRTEYEASVFQIKGGDAYRVKDVVEGFVSNGESAMTIFPTIFVIAENPEAVVSSVQDMVNSRGYPVVHHTWLYAFDLDISAEEQVEITGALRSRFESYDAEIESLEANRIDFYSLFGGLFFLGVMLSLVFLTAAVLIIYYKQVSEGYEDQSRFEIMQKVGMTKREIRKSINSQMMTVFFLPILTAGVHLSFAFPMIHKMLQLFNLWNTNLLIATTVGCFLIFGVFYGIVYRITSNAYYSIVSGAR